MRRRLVFLAFLAACAIALAPGVTALLAQISSASVNHLATRELKPAIAAMTAEEAEALKDITALRGDEARAQLYRSRLDDALRDTGARVLNISAEVDTPVGAGVLQRRIELRFSCPPGDLDRVLAAIRSSVPTLQVIRVTFDAAATTLAAPEPLLTVEGFVWVTPAGPPP